MRLLRLTKPPKSATMPEQSCYTRTYSARPLVKAVPMLTVLFFAECSGICAAMSIVAWLGDPSGDLGSGRAIIIRFVAPPSALVLGLMTVSDFQQWLTGEQFGAQPPGSWVLVGGVFLAVAGAMALAAVRQGRTNRQGFGPKSSWTRSSVWQSQRRRLRRRQRRKRPE